MRFDKHLRYSCDEEAIENPHRVDCYYINQFRALDIKLVREDTRYKRLVDGIAMKYMVVKEAKDILNDLNKDLKKYYSGKYKFDFCLLEGIDMKSIRLNSRGIESLKLKLYKSEDRLEKIKRSFEKELLDERRYRRMGEQK